MDLFHKIEGAGETVVILHGLFGMSDNWKTLARRLSDTYSVVLVDLPNHGRSPRLDHFELSKVAEALYEFLTTHWMYEIRLVGHSLGAKVAMTFAIEYPDMVDKLVCVDMGVHQYQRGHDTIFKALHNVDLQHETSRNVIAEKLEPLIPDVGTRLFLMKNLKREAQGFSWKFDLPVLSRDYENILVPMEADEPFDHPTLFVRGGRSAYVDFESQGGQIRSIFPNAEFATIADAGHWIHADQPEELERTLRAFLQ